jgi:sugar lactone lactonase YvrE
MTETQTVDAGVAYLPGEPVTVLVRHRGIRYDIGDGGRAVAIAGRPPGWRTVAERVVAEDGFNVARDGRVFVLVTEGRDVDALAARIAETSLRLCDALLDLQG